MQLRLLKLGTSLKTGRYSLELQSDRVNKDETGSLPQCVRYTTKKSCLC